MIFGLRYTAVLLFIYTVVLSFLLLLLLLLLLLFLLLLNITVKPWNYFNVSLSQINHSTKSKEICVVDYVFVVTMVLGINKYLMDSLFSSLLNGATFVRTIHLWDLNLLF